MKTNLKTQLEAYKNEKTILGSCGKKDKEGCFNFYDWFCQEKSLKNKALNLMPKVKKFSEAFGVEGYMTILEFAI